MLTQPAPAPVSIPVLFAAQVARAPEAVAMSFEGRSMTYRELEEAANRLAHLLAGHGVGPGACVALLLPRSAEAIVAIVGGAEDRGGVSADRPGGCRRPGSGSCSPMPRRSPRSPPPGWPGGWTGTTCWSSMSTTPPSMASPTQRSAGAGRRGYRLPDLHLGHHRSPQGGGGHPPQRDPAAGVAGCRTVAGRQVWSQCHSLAFDFSVWEILGALLGGGRLVVVPDAVVALTGRLPRVCWSLNRSAC